MITIDKIFEIQETNDLIPPYTYEFIVENNLESCISVNQQSGTTNRFINVTFTFSSQECVNNAVISLRVFSKSGCQQTIPVNLNNPCTAMVVDISDIGNNTYTANVINGTPRYTYLWNYDTAVYTAENTNEQTIQLNYTGGQNPPEASELFLTVTDSNGCFVNTIYNIALCKPTVRDYVVTANCIPSDLSRKVSFCIEPTICPNRFIAWKDTVFNNPNGFETTFTQECGSNGRLLEITIPSNVPSGSYSITYYVYDNFGIVSNIGTINIAVPVCSNDPDIISSPKPPFQIPCSANVGDIYIVPETGSLEDCIQSTTPVDWGTFEFTTGTLSNGNQTTQTPLGANVNFNQTNNTIEYTIPQLSGTDAFTWKVCNQSGNCTENTTYAIILECQEPPVANDDVFCATCNNSITLNITANDMINGSINTITITQAPQNGQAVVTGNTIVYTANALYKGSDSFKYTVTNNNNLTSNEATVTLDVICAGQSSNIYICS